MTQISQTPPGHTLTSRFVAVGRRKNHVKPWPWNEWLWGFSGDESSKHFVVVVAAETNKRRWSLNSLIYLSCRLIGIIWQRWNWFRSAWMVWFSFCLPCKWQRMEMCAMYIWVRSLMCSASITNQMHIFHIPNNRNSLSDVCTPQSICTVQSTVCSYTVHTSMMLRISVYLHMNYIIYLVWIWMRLHDLVRRVCINKVK